MTFDNIIKTKELMDIKEFSEWFNENQPAWENRKSLVDELLEYFQEHYEDQLLYMVSAGEIRVIDRLIKVKEEAGVNVENCTVGIEGAVYEKIEGEWCSLHIDKQDDSLIRGCKIKQYMENILSDNHSDYPALFRFKPECSCLSNFIKRANDERDCILILGDHD